MKQCRLCKAKVHEDDLTHVIGPMGGILHEVCPSCTAELEDAYAIQILRIKDRVALREIKLK